MNFATVEPHYLGRMEHLCANCHALHWLGERLTTSSMTLPRFGSCCLQGKVCIDYVAAIHPQLLQLYTGNDSDAREFRVSIRRYNKAFAFTSTGGSGGLDGSIFDGRGPPSYKIQGETFHQIGPLLPDPSKSPLYSQLYIYDPNEALRCRKANNKQTRPATMKLLQNLLTDQHPFVEVYRQAHELALSATMPDYYLRMDFLLASDRRRYNVPSGNCELAAIVPGDVESLVNARDIIIRPRGGALRRIKEVHPAYVTLHFPLLAPSGQLGWHPDMKYTLPPARPRGRQRERLTFCDFLKHRLHIRPEDIESNHYFRACLLFQEWIVDMWAAAEHSRLEWIRHNQKTLRADLYSGVVDALQEGLDPSAVGRKVILPASFTSGPRSTHQNLQDALALLRIFKGSDLFITFTANPAWTEVTESLLPGQSASDRPDIVSRVFNLKFTSLLADIMKKNVFGKAEGYVYTVEYQKRGLPHIHLIVFLHPDSRLSTPERVDQFLSTELPDEQVHPQLLELVKTHMIHGPCGSGFYSPCLNDKKVCTKGFPKPYKDETDISGESYVKTKRRNTGKCHKVRHAIVDNRNVVSYSPYLLLRYRAHINVECTTGFNAIKYIYKVSFKYMHVTACDMNFGTVCVQRSRSCYNKCAPRQ